MTGKAGLKAGAIGVAIMLVWTVIGQFLPLVGVWRWISIGVSLLIYIGIGILAGLFVTSPRTPGRGAGSGAIAGLVSGVVSGVVGTIILVVRLASGGDIPSMTPEQMQQLQQLTEGGVNPTMFALFAIPGVVCVTSVGAGLAAAGGAIYAAIRPD